jgi:hypothetical protein
VLCVHVGTGGQANQFRLDAERPLRLHRMDLFDFPLADVTLVYFAVRWLGFPAVPQLSNVGLSRQLPSARRPLAPL